MKKVILIELFAYHSECLYSQIRFLKDSGGADITLVANQKLRKTIEAFDLDFEVCYFDFGKLGSFIGLRSFIINNKADVVILNTLQGSAALKFSLLPFPRRIDIVGTLHDTSKLETSFGQRIISRRFDRFYTLSKYIRVPESCRLKLHHTYFNPCYFKEYKPVELAKNDDIWVAIPGSVSLKRRDYYFLIELAKNESLNPNVKFVLLGNIRSQDGLIFSEKIREEGIADRFIIFDQFVSDELFHSYLSYSDYLFPLIHPETPSAKQYRRNKISGVFPLSLAYRKTMLCHQIFSDVEDFEYPATFYQDVDACIALINTAREDQSKAFCNYQEDKARYLSLIGLS